MEFVKKNYEIGLLATLFLYGFLPTYTVLFLICTVVAIGRGKEYKEWLAEFLKTLADNNPMILEEIPEPSNTTPISRTRARRRRGSE